MEHVPPGGSGSVLVGIFSFGLLSGLWHSPALQPTLQVPGSLSRTPWNRWSSFFWVLPKLPFYLESISGAPAVFWTGNKRTGEILPSWFCAGSVQKCGCRYTVKKLKSNVIRWAVFPPDYSCTYYMTLDEFLNTVQSPFPQNGDKSGADRTGGLEDLTGISKETHMKSLAQRPAPSKCPANGDSSCHFAIIVIIPRFSHSRDTYHICLCWRHQ